MNKRQSVGLGGIICLIISSYLMYYLLLQDDILPFSIESVTAAINRWVRHTHIVVFGLLPVYVAFMIFGTAILGIYFGAVIQRWVAHFFSPD